MFMRYLAHAIGQMYREEVKDAGAAGGGGVTVDATAARTYLGEFGHAADSLKTMPDADVLKLHGNVSASVKKHGTPATPKQDDIKLSAVQDGPLTQAEVDQLAAFAKESGMSQKAADALLKRNVEARLAFKDAESPGVKARVEEWSAQTAADKDLGGANLVTTQRVAQLAIDKFVKPFPGIAAIFKNTGYGHHPEVVRMFAAIGKAMDEGKGLSAAGGPGAAGKKSAEELLYGGTQQS